MVKIGKLNLSLAALMMLSLSVLPGVSSGQAFPDKPITIVVPFAPGGTVDIVARAIAPKLGKNLNTSVVVENKAGASAQIGTVHVAHANPDGYTMLAGSTTSISIRPQIEPPPPYNPEKDFVPVTLAAYVPHVLVAAPTLPIKSVADLVNYNRKVNRPLAYGDVGPGSPHYLAGDLFKQGAGITLNHIPYKGTSAAVTDLIAGHIDFASVELSVAAPYIATGKMNPIGLSALKRDPVAPNLATIAEQGVKGYEITSWFGYFVPAKTPPEVVAKLNAGIIKTLADPEVRDHLEKAGLRVAGSSTEEFQALLRSEKDKWRRAIKASE